MDLEELTLLTVYADARIEPSTPSGTEIILVQGGKVSVGRIFYKKHFLYPETYIDHPKNQDDLVKKATELINKKDNTLLKRDTAIILTCPKEIIELMIW